MIRRFILIIVIALISLKPLIPYPIYFCGCDSYSIEPQDKSSQDITKMREEIRLQKMELELRRLTIQRQRFAIIAGVFILLFFATLFFYLKIREERRKSHLENELMNYKQKVLARQMNPHFLYNTLSSLQYFILNHDRIASNDYLTKFSKLMRMALENSQYDLIVLRDEIEIIKLYLDLESMRFPDKFEFKIHIQGNGDFLDHKIPCFLFQPYVENAVWHGLRSKKTKGHLKIHLNKQDNNLICIIEDDGIGREKAREIIKSKYPEKKPMGTRLTQERLSLLNALFGSNITIETIDLKDSDNTPEGTRVVITIPL